MGGYTPTPEPLPGKQWTPSNSGDADFHLSEFCCTCARDKAMREGADFDECDDDELCEIIAALYRGEAVEWRELPTGEIKCVAFVPYGERIPEPRCVHTKDMFGEVAS